MGVDRETDCRETSTVSCTVIGTSQSLRPSMIQGNLGKRLGAVTPVLGLADKSRIDRCH